MKAARMAMALAALFLFAVATQITSSQTAPAALTPASLAGDWEWAIGGPYKAILHLRAGAGGTLTGTIDTIMTTSDRKPISNIRLTGDKLSYKNADGTTYEGTVSADRKTIVGKPGGTIIIWRLTKSAAEATASDANEKPSPTDGTWTGVIRNVPYKGFPKPPDTVRVVIHLSSNPASCKMAWPDASAEPGVACVLELSGNKVKITQLDHLAGFDGTLTPNLQLVGNWAGSIPAGFIWGPVQITLTRASSPSH